MVNPTVNKIISATDRTAAARGAKVLIVGPTGVGKTSLLHGLEPATTLFIDIEAGDLPVADFRSTLSGRELGPSAAIWRSSWPDPIRPSRRTMSIPPHTTPPSKINSAIRRSSRSTRLFSSTASPPSAGFASNGQANSRKLSASAPASVICVAPTGCMLAKRSRG